MKPVKPGNNTALYKNVLTKKTSHAVRFFMDQTSLASQDTKDGYRD